MCAVVYYRKRIRGRLYPVAARTGPYAFANEVTRVSGKITSKYVGILKVPEGKSVDVVETRSGTAVIETRAGRDVIETERGQGETSPANPRRFGPRASEFRVSKTDSETKFLATGYYYGIHLERNVLALDWSRLRCETCGYEGEGTPDGRPIIARVLSEVASDCPKCSKKTLVPAAFAPDLVASNRHKLVVEIYGEKSSVKDAAKMGFYRANGFTVVTVPNAIANDPEWSKPIFQLLAVICGSDRPERLFMPEIG